MYVHVDNINMGLKRIFCFSLLCHKNYSEATFCCCLHEEVPAKINYTKIIKHDSITIGAQQHIEIN